MGLAGVDERRIGAPLQRLLHEEHENKARFSAEHDECLRPRLAKCFFFPVDTDGGALVLDFFRKCVDRAGAEHAKKQSELPSKTGGGRHYGDDVLSRVTTAGVILQRNGEALSNAAVRADNLSCSHDAARARGHARGVWLDGLHLINRVFLLP